ncbi:MAG: alpha/beta hydrolase [Pseudomonadota bacterium]
MSLIKRFVVACGIIYLASAVVMVVFQRQLLYIPSTEMRTPTSVGLTDVTVEALETPDGETLVLWYAQAPEGRPTVLFFHGNGGDISGRAGRFAAYRRAGYGVAFLSWRGYGGSTGAPSETGLLTDARTAYDWLIIQGVSPDQIVLAGESLGTGVAVQLAAERPSGAMTLGAPYSAAVDVAADLYWWLPVRYLMWDQFRSIDHIGRVTAPTLIQHGTTDRVIPYASGRALYEATTPPTTFQTMEGVGHEALYRAETWAQEIAFLDEVFTR